METLSAFLERNLLSDPQDHDRTEIEKISRAMADALNQQPSSMPMLPTYLSVSNQIEENKPVIVLDAGGTNLRVALVTIRNQGAIEECFAKYPMLGTQGPMNKEEFFDAVAEKIIPLCERSNVISFCFSYLTEPLPDHDAVVTSLCKEIHIEGIAGAHVCAELAKALRRLGITKAFEFYLLNDSVASVLGGISELNPSEAYDGNVGLIWGTGFNICYSEDTDIVPTAFFYPFDSMLINTEAGDYDGFAQGDADAALDRQSMQPGLHQAEKMIGGGYLGDLIVQVIRAGAKEQLLPAAFAEIGKLDLREVDLLLSNNMTHMLPECTEEDIRIVKEIILAVYRRAARLVAYMLAAVAQRIKKDRSDAKIAVIADGSTLLKSEYLMNTLNQYCEAFCAPQNIRIDLIPSSNVILKGTAYAALLETNEGYIPGRTAVTGKAI